MSSDPTFRPLPWQSEAWTRMAGIRARGRLAHAWILSGPAGAGKRRFAGALTAALLCSKPDTQGLACGNCERCRMLSSGGHPDAHLLCRDGHLGLALTPTLQRDDGITHWEPKGESRRKEIGIDAIRSLIDDKLPLAAHFGGEKVAVITPADLLSRASADALLKSVEEPRAGTTLILISEQAMSLSATLRSRCQILRLGIPRPAAALTWLQGEMPGLSSTDYEAALSEARGAPLAAESLLRSGGLAEFHRWRTSLDDLAIGRGDPLKVAASIDEESTIPFLHMAQAWLTSRLRGQCRPPSENAAAATRIRAEPLAAELVVAHHRLESNVRGLLVLEALLISWRRALAPGGPASSESAMMTNHSRQ